jgi:NMD protein affecting ribosome stability and mRNA decay
MKTPIRGGKRYNPASFKKKVDTQTDSYLPKGAPGKMVVCPGCHALSSGKRWRLDEAAYMKQVRQGTARRVFCPACEKIRDGYPSGQVTLNGPFLAEHWEEILQIIKNEEERARETNPLQRIMSLSEKNGRLDLTTTDEKLAQRIGRELRKACGGKVAYKWSHNDKFLRVHWER